MPQVVSKPIGGSYPVRGVIHLVHHSRRLGKPIAISTFKACAVSLLALIPLYRVGYHWQVRLIGHFYRQLARDQSGASLASSILQVLGPGTMAVVTSGILCLAESFMVTSQVTQYFIGSIRDRLFDAVLEEHGMILPVENNNNNNNEKENHHHHHHHEHQQPILDTVEDWVVEKLDIKALPSTSDEMKSAAKWWLSGTHIMGLCAKEEASEWPLTWLPPVIYIISLPLTFIPMIGPVGFLAMQGICQGGAAHRRYFDMYQWSNTRRQQHINRLYWQYHQFGMVASALEMVPFFGFFFAYTNQVGAAMLVVDWKKEKML
ncbi:uncharacterized protein BX664DRAFT_362195 [Halteromyces radiatus]|uniref:uncharacterized protein n=1 Tax=Halteromyces radiatus TaxID=101107 RepID=UPI00221F68CF|nr:uncharacterized protein BX664DRAFT_362195 [Halteromyces radiatus]KAI8080085.1 hypothetical protein BX664DRAFT_362195 [Halteromyces radiatus]